MNYLGFVEDFAKENKISIDLAITIINEAIATIYKKQYGQNYNNIHFDPKNKYAFYQTKKIVEKVKDPVLEISLEEATKYLKKNEKVEIGKEVQVPFDFNHFDRKASLNMKQLLKQKISEINKDIIYNEYKNKKGTIVVGKIKSKTDVKLKGYYVAIEPKDAEAFLPESEMIPDEEFEKNELIKALLIDVKKNTNKEEPQLILSRASEEFVKQLLIANIPELSDGTFVIRGIARKPGEVTKVVIESVNENLDPVSITIGKKGTRIQPVKAILGNERIEIVRWSDNPKVLITGAITSSRVLKGKEPEVINIELSSEKKEAKVVVHDEFIAPLIGKKGAQQKLIEKITGWSISFVPYSKYKELLKEKQKELDKILGISDEEEVEIIEEESIPISSLPFTAKQKKLLTEAGFTDVAQIIQYSIQDLSTQFDISIDDAMAIWKVIEENVDIEDEEE